jgi:hypothetical protein
MWAQISRDFQGPPLPIAFEMDLPTPTNSQIPTQMWQKLMYIKLRMYLFYLFINTLIVNFAFFSRQVVDSQTTAECSEIESNRITVFYRK